MQNLNNQNRRELENLVSLRSRSLPGIRHNHLDLEDPTESRDRLVALRKAENSIERKPLVVVTTKMIETFLGELRNAILMPAEARSTQMCKNYGHSIVGEKATADGIFCRDCGSPVTSLSQLRRSQVL